MGSHDILLTAEMNQGTFPVIGTVVLILLLSLREYWNLWENDGEMLGVVRIKITPGQVNRPKIVNLGTCPYDPLSFLP